MGQMILLILTPEQRTIWENRLVESVGITACFDYVVDLSIKGKIYFYKAKNFRKANKVAEVGNLNEFLSWLTKEICSQAGRLV